MHSSIGRGEGRGLACDQPPAAEVRRIVNDLRTESAL